MAIHDATVSLSALADQYVNIHFTKATLTATAYPLFNAGYKLLPPRLAYEDDGTTIVFTIDGALYENNYDRIKLLNSMEPTFLVQPTPYVFETNLYRFVFPEVRDVYYVNAVSGGEGGAPTPTWYVYKSTDTTNGEDGTWTQIATFARNGTGVPRWLSYQSLRNDPVAVNALGVKGLRFQVSNTNGTFYETGGYAHKIHIYGNKIDSTENSRLAFWHPINDMELPYGYLDWGYAHYDEEIRSFRIKNTSAYKRAVDVSITTDDIDNPYKTAAYHTLNYAGGGYVSSLNIGNMQAGTISDVINIKRSFVPAMGSGHFELKLRAHPREWKQYIHFTSAAMSADAGVVAGRTLNRYADATLTASGRVSDGVLYRNSGAYRNAKTYRGGNLRMTLAGGATLTAKTEGLQYPDVYNDAYTFPAMANAYNPVQRTTATLTAVAKSDMFVNAYVDTYGGTGLSGEATKT